MSILFLNVIYLLCSLVGFRYCYKHHHKGLKVCHYSAKLRKKPIKCHRSGLWLHFVLIVVTVPESSCECCYCSLTLHDLCPQWHSQCQKKRADHFQSSLPNIKHYQTSQNEAQNRIPCGIILLLSDKNWPNKLVDSFL